MFSYLLCFPSCQHFQCSAFALSHFNYNIWPCLRQEPVCRAPCFSPRFQCVFVAHQESCPLFYDNKILLPINQLIISLLLLLFVSLSSLLFDFFLILFCFEAGSTCVAQFTFFLAYLHADQTFSTKCS